MTFDPLEPTFRDSKAATLFRLYEEHMRNAMTTEVTNTSPTAQKNAWRKAKTARNNLLAYLREASKYE